MQTLTSLKSGGLEMWLQTIFICLLLIAPSAAQATVYEFTADGAVLKHEAYDYRSPNGADQFETFMPYITPAPYASFLDKENYDALIQKFATNYNISADFVRAVINTESAGKYDAVSPKGAQGLMQLMPATARQYGVTDPFDPAQNIEGGVKYLSYLLTRYDGNTQLALAAYNAGEGAVDKYKGIPPYPETISYVRKIEEALK